MENLLALHPRVRACEKNKKFIVIYTFKVSGGELRAKLGSVASPNKAPHVLLALEGNVSTCSSKTEPHFPLGAPAPASRQQHGLAAAPGLAEIQLGIKDTQSRALFNSVAPRRGSSWFLFASAACSSLGLSAHSLPPCLHPGISTRSLLAAGCVQATTKHRAPPPAPRQNIATCNSQRGAVRLVLRCSSQNPL